MTIAHTRPVSPISNSGRPFGKKKKYIYQASSLSHITCHIRSPHSVSPHTPAVVLHPFSDKPSPSPHTNMDHSLTDPPFHQKCCCSCHKRGCKRCPGKRCISAACCRPSSHRLPVRPDPASPQCLPLSSVENLYLKNQHRKMLFHYMHRTGILPVLP